jgi:hypothetical protein
MFTLLIFILLLSFRQKEACEIAFLSVYLYVPINVAWQRLSKHVPAATNTHATIELLDAVFAVRSV